MDFIHHSWSLPWTYSLPWTDLQTEGLMLIFPEKINQWPDLRYILLNSFHYGGTEKHMCFSHLLLILLTALPSVDLLNVLFIIIPFIYLAIGTVILHKRYNGLEQQFFIFSSVGIFSWSKLSLDGLRFNLQVGSTSASHVSHCLLIKPRNIIKLQLLHPQQMPNLFHSRRCEAMCVYPQNS